MEERWHAVTSGDEQSRLLAAGRSCQPGVSAGGRLETTLAPAIWRTGCAQDASNRSLLQWVKLASW